VWSWKDVVKRVPKGRVGNTFVCGEKTWCTLGICNEDCGSWMGRITFHFVFLWFFKLKRYLLAEVFYFLKYSYKMQEDKEISYKPLMLVGKIIGKRLKLDCMGKTLIRLAMLSFYFSYF
jgi:hypothetical protein